jgi:lariat debranching enzyme
MRLPPPQHSTPSVAPAAAAASPSIATTSSGVRIAIVGCGHGELDQMYACVSSYNAASASSTPPGRAIDLLLCCGDFESVRNYADLASMACPQKYRALNSFYKYYTGEKRAPVLTMFIGGNHEASNYLGEL